MYALGVAAQGLPLLSQGTRKRVLEEARFHIMERYTRDPAMPGPVRTLIEAMIRVFWVDIVLEVEADNRKDAENAGGQDEAELAAAPAIAEGMLQVLVVEARNLTPVHGIGTNPYVRAVLGQQVRRSWTAWSNLRPAWNYIMDFTVVDTSGTLELEVLSQAPLFGGDTRLGYVSLPLKEIILKAAASPDNSQLSYCCEPLAGAKNGELVLILDYKPLAKEMSRSTWLWGPFRRIRQLPTRFRAFFLYHYWPCDKSAFQMYLKEPVDITLLLLSLSPFVLVRAAFYTVLLLCLCLPWPPDEHQIAQFILALKGLAVVTDGIVRMLYGLLAYYSCARVGTCSTGGTPGSGIGAVSIAVDLYQEILVWCVCFFLLPRSAPYRPRGASTISRPVVGASSASSSNVRVNGTPTNTAEPIACENEAADSLRGGRMKALQKYNLFCFAMCLSIFLGLSAWDVLAVDAHDAWAWRIPENLFWSRTLFGISMFPFLFLLHPQINRLLTHSTPTGFTRLGILRRYNTRLRPRRQQKKKSSSLATAEAPNETEASPSQNSTSNKRTLSVDPVEDLRAAIRWFPGGSLALGAGSLGFKAAAAAARTTGKVVSLEIRVASAAVSLGLRAVDASVSTALHVAHCVPGSDIALQAGEATLSVATGTGRAGLHRFARLCRWIPGGEPAIDTIGQVLQEVGLLAAVVESPGLAADVGPNATPLLQVGTEKAEALKLEAAARLAEMLTRAERLAEREAADAFERVRPEIGKISQALQAQSRGCRAHANRAYGACDSLSRSVYALSVDMAQRLPSAGEVFLRGVGRELGDMRQSRAERSPGWMPMLEAYSRVVFSAACEAAMELRPQLRQNQAEALQAEDAPKALPRHDSEPNLRPRRPRSQSPSRRALPPKGKSRRSSSCSPRAACFAEPTGGDNGDPDWTIGEEESQPGGVPGG